jgi:hypothetical protein
MRRAPRSVSPLDRSESCRPRRARLARTLAAAAALTASVALLPQCWSRFSELEEKAPVVRFDAPPGILGFGQAMATVPPSGATRLLVGGQPYQGAAAAYEILSDAPSAASVDDAYCRSSCAFGTQVAALTSASFGGAQHPLCFVFGVGELAGARGLLGRCADGAGFALGVPAGAAGIVEAVLAGREVPTGFIAWGASGDARPVVAAGAVSVHLGWFYAYDSALPTSLESPPGTDLTGFGASAASAALSQGGYLVAMGAPTLGKVHLFRIDSGGAPSKLGCIAGPRAGYGTYLHVGRVAGRVSDVLVIGDGQTLEVFDAGSLAQIAAPADCGSAGTPPSDARLTTIACAETGPVSGCAQLGAEFGHAFALGDVDGDGRTEAIVGASTMTNRSVAGAGAVLVYRIVQGAPSVLAEARYLARPEPQQGLGSSVAALRFGARDIIAAGAPGAGAFFVFYCSTLGGAGKDSFRCK